MRGLHVHVGSQILDVEPFAASVAPVARLGEFPIYDLGGGLGSRYTWADNPPTVGDYLDSLIGAAREHLPAGAQIIIEPGRSMVCEAATTIYRVTTVKRGKVTFVAVDVGWATTSRSPCSSSGSRPASSVASRGRTSRPSLSPVGTARAVTSS